MAFTDVRPNAPYKAQVTTPATAVARTPANEIFKLRGATVLVALVDQLHNIDQGVLLYLYGGVFYTLCYHDLPDTPSRNLQNIVVFLDEHAADGASKLRLLRLKQFLDPDAPHKHFPCVKASAMKAAVARALLPAVYELVVHYDQGDELSRLRIAAVFHMVRLCKVLNQNKLFFLALR